MTDNLVQYITVEDIDEDSLSELASEEVIPNVTPEEKALMIKEQAELRDMMAGDVDQYVNKIVASYQLTGSLPEQYSDLAAYADTVEDNFKHEAIERGRLTQGAQLILDRLKVLLVIDGIMMPKAMEDLSEYVKLFSEPMDPKARKKALEGLSVGLEFIGSKHVKYLDRTLAYTRAFYGLCSMLEGSGSKKEDYGAILMRAGTAKRKPARLKSKEGRPSKKLNPMLNVEEHYGKQDEEDMEM